VRGPSPANVQLVNSLAGAGRIEMVVMSGGNIRNAIEVFLVPNATADTRFLTQPPG
jgi:hypothetical protein